MQTIRHFSARLIAETEIDLPVDATIFRTEVAFYQGDGYQIRVWCLAPAGEPKLEKRIIRTAPLNAGVSAKVLHTDAALRFLDTWTEGPNGGGPVHGLFIEEKS